MSRMRCSSSTVPTFYTYYERTLKRAAGHVAGNPGRLTEMDDAAEGLAYGDEPLYYRVR